MVKASDTAVVGGEVASTAQDTAELGHDIAASTEATIAAETTTDASGTILDDAAKAVDEALDSVTQAGTSAVNWFRQSMTVVGKQFEGMFEKSETSEEAIPEGQAANEQAVKEDSVDQTEQVATATTESNPVQDADKAAAESPLDAITRGFKKISLSFKLPGLNSDTTQSAKTDSIQAESANVKEILADTKDKLAERGDKLEQVDQKTEDLANQASGLLDMAKQIETQEKDRKWWQL